MDNLSIEKVWHDEELIEIKVSAHSEFIDVYQNCYISESDLKMNIDTMLQYTKNCDEKYYIEFGEKEGNYSPAFSMCIFPIDEHGHMKIEMDMEIADNNSRCHRCMFYIDSEIGLLDQYVDKLKKLVEENEGYSVHLI